MAIQHRLSRVSTAGVACRGEKYLVALRKPGTTIGESWEFPGGKKHGDETPGEALKREFREEFSVDIVVGKKLYSGFFSNNSTDYLLEAYNIQLLDDAFVLKEHQAVRWFSLKNLKHLPMADSDRKILSFLEENSPQENSL